MSRPKVVLLDLDTVAHMLSVHPETLRRWDNEGRFKAIRLGKRRYRKYDQAYVDAAIKSGKI